MSSLLQANNSLVKTINRRMLSRQMFTLYDPMTDLEKPCNVPIHWFDQVSSTMDKVIFNFHVNAYVCHQSHRLNNVQAKELAKQDKSTNHHVFGVVADRQYKGRGTRGRDWVSSRKNMFLTVAIKQSLIPIPLNYLPLRYIKYSLFS